MSEAVTRIRVGGSAGGAAYVVLVGGRQCLGELGALIGGKAWRVAVVHMQVLAARPKRSLELKQA